MHEFVRNFCLFFVQIRVAIFELMRRFNGLDVQDNMYCNASNIFKFRRENKLRLYFFISTIGILLPLFAEANHDTLILGCRPWDGNIAGINLPADFVDFYNDDQPKDYGNFFYADFNDNTKGKPKFSDLALGHIDQYKTIVIDWCTYHHIRRDDAWADIASMLKTDGELIIPIYCYNMQSRQFESEMKGFQVKEKIKANFSAIRLSSFNKTTSDNSTWQALLSRQNIDEEFKNEGWLLIAIK